MKWLLPALFLVFFPFAVLAQDAVAPAIPASDAQPLDHQVPGQPDIVKDALCFKVRNEAPYKVYGSFVTDYYTAPDGSRAKHRSNFRLDEPGAKDEQGNASDSAEFCSYGPFIPQRKLQLVLRTLVPIFDCQTRIDQGEIVIKGYRKPEPENGTKTWAECYK